MNCQQQGDGSTPYREQIHLDEDIVEVVLTKPPNPSKLSTTLEQMLLGTWGLLETRDLLPAIAEKSLERFVVMTPFLDEFGAKVLGRVDIPICNFAEVAAKVC